MPSDSFSKFQKRLVLAAYFRDLFGVADPEDTSAIQRYHESLRQTKEGFHQDGTSHLVKALQQREGVRLSDAQLLQYDERLREHTASINERRDVSITWRYFQHLAGLMTEHYLHRLNHDAEGLAASINEFATRHNQDRTYRKFPTVTSDELNKLALWMATGSGKTLLMHLHYYQYRHHFGDELDHILLVTPNEGLTDQHTTELRQSGIGCQYYLDLVEGGQTVPPEDVKVIEISKLVEEKTDEGVRVEVDAFEGNNLVFVDEGHKGASSKAGTWRDLRSRLADDGFTFEYSATFGQAVSGSTPASVKDEYGKSILFDYSYQRFYDDGYGKDYTILNLDTNADEALKEDDDLTNRYLLANLLTFYEQQVVFNRDERRLREEYNLRKPLLMFVGHSVTGGRNVSDLGTNDRRSVTDIQRLVAFLNRVLTDTDWATRAVKDLLSDEGKLEIGGQDLFADEFDALRSTGRSAEAILGDLRDRLFHASGGTSLRLSDLKNTDGEIGLRSGDSDQFFGVIDVGNKRGFLNLTEEEFPEIGIEESEFEGSLFKRINQSQSDINVLLGAKKFIEGWSSWRVSTMGLMNIGRGEGPQIIQLFGRGVRLLGKNRSLKRSSALEGSHPRHLPTLETLNIFGVRADYMADFRDYLADEGIETEDREIVRFETQVDDRFSSAGLQLIRPSKTESFVEVGDLTLTPKVVDASDITPEIDLTPKIETLSSVDGTRDSSGDAYSGTSPDTGERRTIGSDLIALLEWHRIYRTLWRYREKEGYTNLTFGQDALKRVIEAEQYDLYCPEEMLECDRFDELSRIESIVLRILRTYITEYYSSQKQEWERETLQYEELSEGDDNLIEVVEARVEESADAFLNELLDRLERVESGDEEKILFKGDESLYTEESGKPDRVYFDKHLYYPLVTQDEPVQYSPPALNAGETQFIKHLRSFLGNAQGREFMGGNRELYVLRNQTRGKGVGFQMKGGGRFFPDFILWLLDEDVQHIIFVDPKGLDVGVGNIDVEPKVQFCQNIADYQKALNERSSRDDIRLHGFIASVTNFNILKEKQAIDTREEFKDRKVYFLEDGTAAIQDILRESVN